MKLAAVAAGVVVVVAVAIVGVVWAAGGLSEDPRAARATSTPAAGAFPEGVFRYRLTKKEVLALVPTIEPRLLEDAVGTFTWTIRDGTISLEQTDCKCSFTRITAPYTATARHFTVHWPKKAANGVEFCSGDCVETVGWSFDGKALHFTPLVTAGYDVVFWGARKPWVKIG